MRSGWKNTKMGFDFDHQSQETCKLCFHTAVFPTDKNGRNAFGTIPST